MKARRILALSVLLSAVAATALVKAQLPEPPRFDVASVKPDPKQDRGGPQKLGEFTLSTVQVLPGGRVESVGRMLRHLIGWAYDINTAPQRVVGEQDTALAQHITHAFMGRRSSIARDGRACSRSTSWPTPTTCR